jgi:hypothetical protein
MPGALGTALVLWAGLAGPAFADHSGTLLLNDRAGPYVLMVFTPTFPPRTNDCPITIVVRQEHLRPLATAVVEVRAERADRTGPPVSLVATRGQGPIFEADLRLPTPGGWLVTIAVTSAAGTGSATFPLDVLAPRWRLWPMVAAGLAVVGVAAGLLARRRRSARSGVSPPRS